MKNKIFFRMLVLSTLSVVLACGSGNSDKESKPEDTLVKVGKWKMNKLEYKEPNNSTWKNYTLETWRVDDFVTFNADGTGIFDEGPTKKQTREPQTKIGEWYFSSDNKTFSVSDNTYTLDGEVIEISNTKLVLIAYKLMGSSNDLRFTYVPY